jgi:hypothetical protein
MIFTSIQSSSRMEILNKNKADFVRDILPCDGVIVEDEDLYVPVHAVGDHGEASLRAVGLLLPANPLKISYVHFMSSLHALRDGVEKPRSVPYTDRVPFGLLDSAALL